MIDKTKWGLIGYGKFGKKIEDSFNQTNVSQLYSIASRSFENIEKNSQELPKNKHLFHNYNELIKQKDIENIYISTTNNLHKDLIISSAQNKKNIICEKPACLNEFDFSECIKEIKKNNVFFMEGLMYLHHPQITKSIELVKSGDIGKIKKIVASFGYRVGKKLFFFELKKIDTKSRLFNPALGGGAIYDLGCYPLTAVLLFFNLEKNHNKIKKYNFKRKDGKYGVDESGNAQFEFECGGIAEINVSIRKDLENTIEIFGTKGSIKIPFPWITAMASNIEVNIKNKKMLVETILKKNIYALEIDNASEAIINNKKEIDYPCASIEKSLEYIKIIDRWKKN